MGSARSIINVFLVRKRLEGYFFPSKVRGEGRAPEITDTTSARFDELENIYFVGYIALPTEQQSHVTV